MAQFKQYKLGFDRMFHVGEVKDDAARVQESAIEAQQAAIAAGVNVHVPRRSSRRSSNQDGYGGCE